MHFISSFESTSDKNFITNFLELHSALFKKNVFVTNFPLLADSL